LRKHVRWPYSRERRQKAAGQRIKDLDEPYIYDELITRIYDQFTGVPILLTRAMRPPERNPPPPSISESQRWPHYVRLYRKLPKSKDEFDKFLSKYDPPIALQDDPDTVDRIGIEETVGYLIDVFNAIAEDYSSKPYEEFITLWGAMKHWAIKECVVLWPGRLGWVKRMVVPHAAEQLETAKRERRDKARDAERERLSAKTKPVTAPTHKAAKKTKPRPAVSTAPAAPAKTSRRAELVTIDGETFKDIRDENGWTQKELGPVATVYRLEYGIAVKPRSRDKVIRNLAERLSAKGLKITFKALLNQLQNN
jgi:hypothetical protein